MSQARLRPFLLVFSLVALLPLGASAQDAAIRGVVRDEAGAPLPGVNVYLDGTRRGAATDVDGRYLISDVPAGTYTLVASAVGFRRAERPVSVPAGVTLAEDFVMSEITLESGEVVVTASRRAQLSASVPVSISVMTQEDLDVRNAVTLDEALRYVSGVQLADNQVSVRGSSGFSYNTGSRVLLLVDGMPMLGPDSDGIPFTALPMAQVERVEVLKGPGSALYGGGALGGVVNVITRDFPERPETRLRLYGGVHEPVKYAAWRDKWEDGDAFRPLGGGSLTHARRVSERFGFWVNLAFQADQGHLRLDEEREFHAYTKLGYAFTPASRLTFLGGLSWRNADAFLYWNGAADPLNPGSIAISDANTTGSNDNRSIRFSLLPSYTHVLSPNLFANVKGRLFGIVLQPLDENLEPRPLSKGTLGFRYGGEAQLNWNPAQGRYLTAGFTTDALGTTSSFFKDDEGNSLLRRQPESAVFGQWEETLFDRLDVTAGLRFDAYWIDAEDVETKLSPKLSLSSRVSEQLTVRAAYGEGFRVPGVAERFINDQSFLPLVMNLDLRPEISRSWELGAKAPLSLPLGGALLDLALFWNEYERLVEPKFIAAQRSFQFVNLTRARIRGAEATLEGALHRDLVGFRLGYTFLDARDLSLDQPLVFRSKHLFVGSLSVEPVKALELGLDYRFASEPDGVDSDFTLFVPDASVFVPSHVLDARVAFRTGPFRTAFIVKNALDYYYLERAALLATPRHFILQLQADF